MQDGDRYRVWYRCDHDPSMHLKRSGHDTAYAESADGIHWEKPDLGLFEVNGSTANNLVWMGPGANMVPFRDPNPDVPDDERYKTIVRGNAVVRTLASPDGIRWRLLQDEPILTDGPFDSVNIAFWDIWRHEYVAYTRGVAGRGSFKGGVRWIRRTTSKDFREWTPLELIDAGDTPFEHLYTNACVQYERAPGTYLMFPSRFVVDRVPDPDWAYSTGVSDIVFMSSRDGLHFDRSFMEAFVRPGLDKNNWHDRGIYMERGILQTSPEELSIYGMENSHLDSMRIRRYALRTDGFVSVRAGYGGRRVRHAAIPVRAQQPDDQLLDFGGRIGQRRDAGRRRLSGARPHAGQLPAHVRRQHRARGELERRDRRERDGRQAGAAAVRHQGRRPVRVQVPLAGGARPCRSIAGSARNAPGAALSRCLRISR